MDTGKYHLQFLRIYVCHILFGHVLTYATSTQDPVDFCMLPPPMTEPKELKNAKTAAWLNGPMMSNWSDCGCKMP